MMKKVAKGQNPHVIGLLFFLSACTCVLNGHAPWIAIYYHQPPAMNPDINQTTEHIYLNYKQSSKQWLS